MAPEMVAAAFSSRRDGAEFAWSAVGLCEESQRRKWHTGWELIC